MKSPMETQTYNYTYIYAHTCDKTSAYKIERYVHTLTHTLTRTRTDTYQDLHVHSRGIAHALTNTPVHAHKKVQIHLFITAFMVM